MLGGTAELSGSPHSEHVCPWQFLDKMMQAPQVHTRLVAYPLSSSHLEQMLHRIASEISTLSLLLCTFDCVFLCFETARWCQKTQEMCMDAFVFFLRVPQLLPLLLGNQRAAGKHAEEEVEDIGRRFFLIFLRAFSLLAPACGKRRWYIDWPACADEDVGAHRLRR